MGSLPDLTERDRPAAHTRSAARTVSDPHRNRTQLNRIQISTIYKKDWLWKKPSQAARGAAAGLTPTARRRDSAASSVGAASVRHLINRVPPRVPRTVVRRFTLLCIGSALCTTSLLPFTALVGAEDGALALALMHTVAAIVAPFTPLILQKAGARVVISAGHALVCVLLSAHAMEASSSFLWPLYGICGFTLSPLSLALSVSASSLAQSAGDEGRRRVALRRATRALRASQDIGLIIGSLILGAALLIWPDQSAYDVPVQNVNTSISRWPPAMMDDAFLDDDIEEHICGSSGCPDNGEILVTESALSKEGRQILLLFWAILSLSAIVLGICGAASTPAPPPDTRSTIKDPRALLGAPMGLFIGLQQGFMYTSFVKWYGVCVGGWTCAWLSLFGAGALQTVAAATLSMAAARGRRGALAAGGAAAHASLMLALLRWRAAKSDVALPAVAAAAWGACAALWDVLQASVCIGGGGWRGPWSITLASRHAGLAIACASRKFVCARSQLIALAAALLAALASHTALEIRLRRAEPPKHRS